MGIPYTFEVLLDNLGVVLSGGEGYKLNPEIFTKLMGNPTPTRWKSFSIPCHCPHRFPMIWAEIQRLGTILAIKPKEE